MAAIVEPGFGVPDVPKWSSFVSTGALARTLTRMCWLVKSRVELGYRLTVTGERAVVTILLGEREHVYAIVPPEHDSAVFATLETVLEAINGALAEHGRVERFAVLERGGALHTRHRIIVRDADDLAISPIDARVAQRFDGDGSLLGLVGNYVEQLCRFAGLSHITCEGRWVQDPGLLTFTFENKPPDSGGMSRTLRVRVSPELDVQEILDTINGELEDDKKLYRIAREPDRVDVALLDKTAAAELRRIGDLIEQPARETLRAIGNAGFELPSLYGEWKNWGGFRLRTELVRMCLLATGIAEMSVKVESIDVEDRDGTLLVWIVNGVESTARYGVELANRQTAEVLGMICGDVNRALAAQGIEHRFLVMTGEPHFYGYRLVLLDRAWLGRIARSQEVLPGCLDNAMHAAIDHVIGMHPIAEPATEPPRLQRMEEICARADILDHDFKCSARPSDYFDLIEEIARFARIAVEVAQVARSEGELWAIDVTYRGATTTLRIENQKYVNVSPILQYVNGLLDTRKPHRQIYSYRAGGWSGGIVRATDEEAEKLRALGYI